MRIVHVTPRYVPRIGGVEAHVQEVSERLVERGHEVVVLSADFSDEVDRHARIAGVEVRRHRAFAPGGSFHVAPGITRSIRRTTADVVHAHNYHSLPMLFAALGLGEESFVVTPHYHGASASRLRDALLSLYRPVGKWALHSADAIVAVSEWERERLQADFGVDPAVVPNGVEAERFRTADPEPRDGPYLLCVGRLEEYKGLQYAIRVLPELPGYELVIAGDGPFEDRLRAAARDVGVDDRVDFLGYVEDDRLPGLFSGAAAHLSLSTFESYGLTVGEALAAGTPCVVREAGALADWTAVEGVVGVSDVDAETVANAVRAAASTGATGTPMGWSGVVDELEAIYERVSNDGQSETSVV